MEKIGQFIVIVSLFLAANGAAAEFNADAVSQVSRSIAEWRLANSSSPEKISEDPAVDLFYAGDPADVEFGGLTYASDALSAFDGSFEKSIESQMKNLGMSKSLAASGKIISNLPHNEYDALFGEISGQALSYSVNKYIPRIAPYYNPISTVHSYGSLFYDTMERTGMSAQIINPPIYLTQKTSTGWTGSGLYSIQGGIGGYSEKLTTGPIGPITRTHTDIAKTDLGSYFMKRVTTTPVSNEGILSGHIERFATHTWPTNSTWDPMLSTEKITKSSFSSYHVETMRGISKITPMPNITGKAAYIPTNWSSQITSYNNAGRSWNAVKNFNMSSISGVTLSSASSIPSTISSAMNTVPPRCPRS